MMHSIRNLLNGGESWQNVFVLLVALSTRLRKKLKLLKILYVLSAMLKWYHARDSTVHSGDVVNILIAEELEIAKDVVRLNERLNELKNQYSKKKASGFRRDESSPSQTDLD
jgi:hypothetical protein